MAIKSIEELDPAGKRILVRVDFNVPIVFGRVGDDTRIREALPTIRYLIEGGGRVIVISHLGRPYGDGYEDAFTLRPVARRLSELLDQPVTLANDVTGRDAQEKVAAMEPGDVLMLENLRFDKREQQNDLIFCKVLSVFADAYVNDAFGAAHRAHASISGVTEFLPSYAGFLLQKEVETLTTTFNRPAHPFVAILGGSKVSDKIGVIDHLIGRADTLIIGGGMCFTFLMAQGKEVGQSLKQEEWVERAEEMLQKAEQAGTKLLLPVDVVVADEFSEDANITTVSVDEIPEDMMGLDIGPETVKLYTEAIAGAATVFWNGPMGVFEMKAYEAGTKAVAYAVAEATEARTIIGGGDSVAAVNKFKLGDKMSFISTGGGASMAIFEGKRLPGVDALDKWSSSWAGQPVR